MSFYPQLQNQVKGLLTSIKYLNLLAVIIFFLLLRQSPGLSQQITAIILFFGFIRAFQFYTARRQIKLPLIARHLLVLLDYAIITYIIIITGGSNSPYFILYFFPVIRNSLHSYSQAGWRGALLAGGLILFFLLSREQFWQHPSFLGNLFLIQVLLLVGWLLGKLNQMSSSLHLLNTLNKFSYCGNNLRENLEQSLDLILKYFNSQFAGIMLFSPEAGLLSYDIVRGNLAEKYRELQLRPGEGLPGLCFITKEAITSANLARENKSKYIRLLTPGDNLTEVCLPLISQGGVRGVLTLANTLPRCFSKEEISTLQLFANQITGAFEKARREEQEQELLNRNEAIFEAISNGLVVLDREGRIVLFNRGAEEIFAVSRLEVAGKYFWDVFFNGEKQDVHGNYPSILLDSLFDGKKVENFERIWENRKGEKMVLIIDSFPLWNEQRVINGAVGIFKNFTHRREMEEQMQQAEKFAVIGQLAAGLAHEIRNPLTSVKGFVQLLQQRLEMGKNRQYLEIIIDELNRVNSLIKEFLLLAKPSAPKRQPTDLEELLRKTVSLMSSGAVMQEISIGIEIHNPLPLVNIDWEQMKQVFINIIQNALDAMPRGGRLLIRAKYHPRKKTVQLDFEDSGLGIPREMLSKVFNPFFTTKEEGSGLGLPVCYRILESHGGFMKIRSIPGRGTTVMLEIPAG